MAITETIESIRNNLTSAYNTLESKGATIPENKNIENLSSTIETVQGGGGGGGLTNGLARYMAGDTTLTELVPSDFGDITSLAKYAFYKQDGTKSNPVNLRKIGLPNTITTIGISPFTNCPVEEITGIDFSKQTSMSNLFNTTPNLAKINDNNIVLSKNIVHDYAFYQIGKAKDLKIEVNLTNTTAQTFNYAFGSIGYQLGSALGLTNNEIIVNGTTNNISASSLNYMFYGTRAKKVVFKDSLGYQGSGVTTPFNYMFGYCYIDEVEFTKATHLNSGTSGGYRMFQTSNIDRLRLPALTTTQYVFYSTTNKINKIFLGSNCALSSASDIQTVSKYFVPYDSYFSYYATATNWSTLFNTTQGTTDTRMFAYKEFTEGEELPHSYGDYIAQGYGNYTIEWYKDDDFTERIPDAYAPESGTFYAQFTLDSYVEDIM